MSQDPISAEHIPGQEPSPADTPLTVPESIAKDQLMEVHHHPNLHHKNKFADYFFEFLMLFLAVTLGFLVENQREHYVEHQRSRQYARFLYDDLVLDTSNLAERSLLMTKGSGKLDTLIELVQSFQDNYSNTARIYDLSAYVYAGLFFSATTSTMEQLKYSGSLRYFQNKDLVRSFSHYDTDLQRLKAVEERNAYLNEDSRRFLAQFLDVNKISRLTVAVGTDTPGFELLQPRAGDSLILFTKQKEQLRYYANLCALKKADWNTRVALQERLLQSGRKLILALKDEYGLKEN